MRWSWLSFAVGIIAGGVVIAPMITFIGLWFASRMSDDG